MIIKISSIVASMLSKQTCKFCRAVIRKWATSRELNHPKGYSTNYVRENSLMLSCRPLKHTQATTASQQPKIRSLSKTNGPANKMKFPWFHRRDQSTAPASIASAEASSSDRTTAEMQTHISSQPTLSTKTHLVLCVNGLFGSPANWTVISRLLTQHLPADSTLVHVSTSNQFKSTFQGIDTCGDRLAKEVSSLIETHPNLERISIVAHSMGGLISRYMVGRLYTPETQRIAGSLEPAHFIALAVPHTGVSQHQDSAGEVPLLNWLGAVPGPVGTGLQKLARTMAPTVSSVSFDRSGQQFFLLDRDNGRDPLIHRLSKDVPGEGYFYSALAAFQTRTAYANKSGDHLVNWATSSIRARHELPINDLKDIKGKGVVREDPLIEAWHPSCRQAVFAQHKQAALGLHIGEEMESLAADIMDSKTPEDLVAKDIVHNHHHNNTTSTSTRTEISTVTQPSMMDTTSSTSQPTAAAIEIKRTESNAYIEANLQQLKKLPWRRVDVCFKGSVLPMLAHQHLQVQREWLNWEGVATAKHVALQLAAMEELYVYDTNDDDTDL